VKEQKVAALRKSCFDLFVCLKGPGSWLSLATAVASVMPQPKSRVPLVCDAAAEE